MSEQIVVVATGEVVETMDRRQAADVTREISRHLNAMADAMDLVLPLIGDALTRRAWVALGYESPAAYVAQEFGRSLERLPVGARRGVVHELTEAGMSTRAIASVVGVDQATVVRDRAAGDAHASPAPSTPEPTAATPSGLPRAEAITGMDGKTYRRPTPNEQEPKPARDPLTDLFFKDTYDVHRLAERLRNRTRDDRFPRNKEKVAQTNLHDLNQAIDLLQQVIQALTDKD